MYIQNAYVGKTLPFVEITTFVPVWRLSLKSY